MERGSRLLLVCVFLAGAFAVSLPGQIRDGGIDPYNLGKGDWIYYMSDATNRLGGNVSSVTNENSLMLWYKSQGIRYIIIKAATSDQLFKGSYAFPQFTSNLVNTAHANNILIFGYNRSYGSNVVGEVAISDYVFQQGADGFVWDAEAEWESNQTWIGTNGPALAWQLCSTVRSNWPTKFLAHAPFPIISYHASFPYKEFGYWSDTIMPQIYHFSSSGIKGSPSAAIEWTDANWAAWQDSLVGQSSVINGQRIYWTNSIKPHAPIQDVYGPLYSTPYPNKDVMEFIDYLSIDPNCVAPGGYRGVSFWRTDLHGAVQWANIKAGTSGQFPGVVNNIVFDDAQATITGDWFMLITFYDGSFYGGTTDTNSFGTNYWVALQGVGSNYVEYTPAIVVPGNYNVYQWHPFLQAASANVPFVISYYGGSTTVYANQTTNSGNWSLLGQFYFDPSTPASVRISDAFPEPTKLAMADGLKLVFLPPAGPPSAPIRLGASTASASQINLAWTDTATNETGFVIARSISPGGPFVEVGSVPANVRTFNCAGLVPETTYYFQVRATNFLGNSSWSSPASATTRPNTSLQGWGDNTWTQLFAPAEATNVIALAAGGWHALALRQDGAVLAWGANWNQQCDVPPSVSNALAIAAGGYHSLAILADGAVAAWGAGDYGQTNVPASVSNAIAVAAGTWHSLALRKDGTVIAWGDNSFGQISVPQGLSNVVGIGAGGNHSLALKADGTVVAWGDNSDALGRFAGQSLVPPGLSNVVEVAAGGYHSLALMADGTVVAWGDNSQGQCALPQGLAGIVQVDGGTAFSLALKSDGTGVAWGANGKGQCTPPATATNVAAIAAGAEWSLALVPVSLPAPRIFDATYRNGKFGFLLQTFCRNRYTVEASPSLTSPSWSGISTNVGNGALLYFQQTPAPSPPQLYRVRQSPR